MSKTSNKIVGLKKKNKKDTLEKQRKSSNNV